MNLLDTLSSLRRGGFVESLDAELKALVTAVRDTGRSGTVTVKLTVKPAAKSDEMALTVVDEIATRLPKVPGGETIMYALAEGALSRRDPRQLEMDGLREVPLAKTEVRTA